jgi:two-component system NtrC family sensor kinase
VDPNRSRPSISRRTGQAAVIAAAVLGAMALVGWATGRTDLTSLRSGSVPMAPNSALALLLLGYALWGRLRSDEPRGVGRAAWLGAAFVLLITIVRLTEYVIRADLAVDRWFLHVPAEPVGLAPSGKMALPTTLGFLVSSLAMILLADRSNRSWRDNLAGGLGLLVTIEGLVFTLGYLHNAPLLYGGRWIPMALSTGMGFVALGIGLIAGAGPKAFPSRLLAGPSVRARLFRVFLPFVAAIVVLVAWITLLVARHADPSYAALTSAASVGLALVVVGVICARIAGYVGNRLERAEAALQRANDELESRIAARTEELTRAKSLLEERNRQLEAAAEDLAQTSASVREAHEELQHTHESLLRAETQLVESEKLSSLGQMVAGVAHEINNPLAFVSSNVAVLQRDIGYLNTMIRFYLEAEGTLAEHQSELLDRIHVLADKIDLPYILENTEGLMARSREGLKRIQQIVKDLREFARLDESELMEADLNAGIRTTVAILQAKAHKHQIHLESNLAPLPPLMCYSAKINQLVLNLIDNAIDACEPGGRVTVLTRALDLGVEIEVVDNGSGIDPSIRSKIFDPFFTTKPVGKGTGLGLSIVYGIAQAHGGRIDVDSTPGCGTRVVAYLPQLTACQI